MRKIYTSTVGVSELEEERQDVPQLEISKENR